MYEKVANYSSRCTRAIVGFCRARRGATAVEFALIAPFFLATLIAVLQTCVFVFAQATLQTAAMTAGRLIMTGQVQNGGVTQSQFLNDICPTIQPLFNCNNLMVNVANYSDFSSANTTAPVLTYNAQGQITNAWSYNPGAPGQVVVVQLIYQWSVVGGPLGFVLSNLPNSMSEIVGVSAFRVEPY